MRAVPLDRIEASPYQPRRTFDEGALERLASSIARSGLMQPIVVRPVRDGFELVAGERRWRAARIAGLTEIPALVRDLVDETAAEWALVENLQREELNTVERAHGLRRLAEQFGLGQAELGERIGLERSTVANLLRLTELEEEIQDLLRTGALSMGHGRALLGMTGTGRVSLARRASDEGWSVRKTEAAVRQALTPGGSPQRERTEGPSQREAVIADLERRLSEHLGTKSRIMMGKGKASRGRLQIDFYSLEQFEDIMQRLGMDDPDAHG